MNSVLAIVGPTGIGKSRLALHLAQVFNGEIVSADSRQVYRYMDIGTAKPSAQDQALVRHHLINIVDPDEHFSLAQYQTLAYAAIRDIHRRNKLPLLVGGSGLYIRAVIEGWQIPRVPPDHNFRRYLEQRAMDEGYDGLYQELLKADKAAAQKIDPRNIRRVIRALEVHHETSNQFSRLQGKKAPSFNTLIIGLTADRSQLYRCVDQRVDEMVTQGLVSEVEKLLNMGYDVTLPAMSSIGYRQIVMVVQGKLSLEAAIQQIKYETHRFIRHQYAWFRRHDDRIHWFDIARQPEAEIEALVTKFLEESKTDAKALLTS